MATLKGIFDSKPQQHRRNFLQENIKKVKTKANLHNLKDGKSQPAAGHKRIMSTIRSSPRAKLRTSSSTRSHMTPPVDLSSACQKQNAVPTCCCKCRRDTPTVSHRKPQRISSRTMHYIHQENVPFEWTEMCPSVVSHNICHQGVQTEEHCCDAFSSSLRRNVQADNIPKDSKRQMKPVNLVPSSKCQEQSLKPETSFIDGTCYNCGADGKSKLKNDLLEELPSKKFLLQPDSSENTTNKNCKGDFGNVLGGDRTDEANGAVEHHSFGNKCSKLACDFGALKVSSRSSTKKSPTGHHVLPSSYQKGVVPKYLARRKNEQLMEAASLEAVDLNCPAGHIAMSDTERKETLDLILKNYNDLVTELNKLPVRTDTLKMKQRKMELEKQLDKLEEGIRVFSRSKVYIKLDE